METLFYSVAGRKQIQPFFEKLYRVSLKGMNFGSGAGVQKSGELNVMPLLNQFPAGETIIIFDVGANIGNYTLGILNQFNRETQIFCFEPAQAAFNSLVTNMAQYKNVQTHNFGFGDQEEISELYSDRESSGLASLYHRRLDHLNINLNRIEPVQLRTADDFCLESGISHIHLYKLDVEGNELNVLKGSSRLIQEDCIDLIQFEFGGCNIDSRTYFQDFFYLLNPNYQIYRILANGFRLVEEYSEKYEIFITTNYLCVSRKLQYFHV